MYCPFIHGWDVPGDGSDRHGEPIKVPVGKEVLGRLFNVLGETIDEKGAVEAERYDAIHRPAPDYKDPRTRLL